MKFKSNIPTTTVKRNCTLLVAFALNIYCFLMYISLNWNYISSFGERASHWKCSRNATGDDSHNVVVVRFALQK
jgi:hypothetical protein